MGPSDEFKGEAKVQAIVRSAWGPLLLYVVGQFAVLAAYASTATPPSDLAVFLHERGPSLALALWVVADAHLRSRTPCCDFGMFTAMGLPLVALWHLFRTRRWRGLLTLLGLTLTSYVPAVLVAMLWTG